MSTIRVGKIIMSQLGHLNRQYHVLCCTLYNVHTVYFMQLQYTKLFAFNSTAF